MEECDSSAGTKRAFYASTSSKLHHTASILRRSYPCAFEVLEIESFLMLLGSGARFSKVPKLFGRISDYILFFVSSKRRCLKERKCFFFFFFTFYSCKEKHVKRPIFQNKLVGVSRMAFRAPKGFETLEEQAQVDYSSRMNW